MKESPLHPNQPSDRQAVALHESVDRIMRHFRLEPGLLAGSVYSDLHVNDIGLISVISESGDWNVRKITDSLGVPVTTISSALDRLEKRKLLRRLRRPGDRRVVFIELTAAGERLAGKLRATQIETCRAMLARLPTQDREELLRLVARVARD
jgi:DNA-binding MarR family transcriptional regulator